MNSRPRLYPVCFQAHNYFLFHSPFLFATHNSSTDKDVCDIIFAGCMLLQIRLSNKLQSYLFIRCMTEATFLETTFAVPTYLFKLLRLWRLVRYLLRALSPRSPAELSWFHGENRSQRPPLLNCSYGARKPITVPLHFVRQLTRHCRTE